MKFEITIKRRFRKPKTFNYNAEDEMWAVYYVHYKYPKHKLMSIKRII